MAALRKHFINDLYVLSRNVFGTVCATSLQPQGVRHLFSPAALGIDNYIKARERVNLQFQNIAEKFRGKMKECTETSSPTAMIFTEDLKNMVHLIDTRPEDIDMITKMIRRFHQQNKSMRFGNFVFGPVVMRMFYHLDQPDAALNAFLDPEMEGFFDQLMSYQILLDLLLQNKLYDSVLQVFDTIKSRQLEGARHPKNVIVLVFAALYKMNTPESLERAKQLWSELIAVGNTPMRRATTFAAALALNQNAPHIALEILGGVSRPNYVTVRNLKIMALAELGRSEDTFPLFRSIIEADVPQVKFTVSKEAVDKVRDSLKKGEKQDLQFEFEQLEKRLIAGEHIVEESQEDWLWKEIQDHRDTNRDKRFLAASFNRLAPGGRDGDYGSRLRPGLAEMF